uniref:Complement C2 n=1 Tax=Anthurium amnicola TaxID=1678845 RepID=A0A1D1YBC2_9ARAE
MGEWVHLLQGRGGGPLLGVPPCSFSPIPTTDATSSLATRRRTIALASRRQQNLSSGDPAPQAAEGSSLPINGYPPKTEWEKEKTQKRQRRQQPSVMEVQRAVGVAGGDDRADGGNRPASVLDFFASTPIGQAESPAEKKLREAAEWVVERTEARGLLGQRILMVVCLSVLPVWVFLLLVASGLIKLPFSLPFMDDLLS